MCGIAGFLGDGKVDIKAMLRSQRHRGPDQEGIWEGNNVVLGCSRLAVIDIEGGRQPILNEDQTSAIVFNGEVFNYVELRKELEANHRFRTKTDTEVILHAYEEWGPKCLDRFNGMFAIAIFSDGKLLLARDRMGEKPLYYHNGSNGFYFASEIKAILTQVDGKVFQTPEFIAFEYPFGQDTYYENVKSLEPGTYLEFDGKAEPVISRYWSIPVGEKDESPRKDSDYAEELRELLKDAVAIRLRSDVPVGIFLSGGIDSAIMAALAGPMEAFTCSFPMGDAFDELEFARVAAENVGIKPHVITPSSDDFRSKCPGILWHLDGPVSTMSSIGEFSLAEAASGKVKVVLGGQGADELFGGYIRYLLMLNENRLAESGTTRQYLPLARKLWGEDFGIDPADRYFKLMCRSDNPPEAAQERVHQLFNVSGGLLDKMTYTDINLQLPALLTMNDRAAASFGLENRCPFLDHRIVEFAFRLPENLRIREMQTKWILRESVRAMVPDVVLDREDKKGLVTPVGEWLRGPLESWVKELLGNKAHQYPQGELGIFDRKLYHALSMEIWDRVRNLPEKPVGI